MFLIQVKRYLWHFSILILRQKDIPMEITVSEITFLQTAGPLISAVVIVLFGYMFGRHNLGETIEQM
jgi:hypothetical protein